MTEAHVATPATARPCQAARSWLLATRLIVAALLLPAAAQAAPVTWTFSGLTVVQTPFCYSADLPCPSDATYAFNGTVSFDPTTNQVFGMSVHVDFGTGVEFEAGAGTMTYQPALTNGVLGTEARLWFGSSSLAFGPYPTGFAGPLAAPPSCVPLGDVEGPELWSCRISLSRDNDARRSILGNVMAIRPVPEPAVGLIVLAGLPVLLRRLRRARRQ